MTIILPTLAIAFAASCVWLTVRVVSRKERWAKWMLVALALAAYPISYGPFLYAWTAAGQPIWLGEVFDVAYYPIEQVRRSGPMPVSRAMAAYGNWWIDRAVD